MIEARELHKVYRVGAVSLHVLKGVSLRIAEGECVAITGPSGAGKSTLLHLLAGLDDPTQGDVLWNGRSVASLSDGERARLRNHAIGFVFQFYHLLPELSALENVMLPGLVNGHRSRRDLKARALECLGQVGLQDRAAHKPSQLSGGESQRAAIARALINRPRVICCDEPTGNLDSQTGQTIAQALLGLHRREGIGLIVVTHEEALARLGDRWLVLRDGQFLQTSG
jgi:lipoprotein-releasing system ATP-binding protein